MNKLYRSIGLLLVIFLMTAITPVGVIEDESFEEKSIEPVNDTITSGMPYSEVGEEYTLITPITPAKKGHWFPARSQSRLYFQTDNSEWCFIYGIHLEIEQVMDTQPRELRIYQQYYESWTLEEELTIDESGFDGNIPCQIACGLDVCIEIDNYPTDIEYGWLLKYIWFYDSDGQPIDDVYEYTNDMKYDSTVMDNVCEMDYYTDMGPYTRLSINVSLGDNNNPHVTSCWIYVDGNSKGSFDIPTDGGSFEVYLGDYDDDSVHEVSLCFTGILTDNRDLIIYKMQVHHAGVYIEYDWYEQGTVNHKPKSSALQYVEEYFKKYSYHRVSFVEGQSFQIDYISDWKVFVDNYYTIRGPWTDQQGDVDWLYLAFANYMDKRSGYVEIDPSPPESPWGTIFFAMQNFIDSEFGVGGTPTDEFLANKPRGVLLHEIGHYLGIPHFSADTGGGKCPHDQCVYKHGSEDPFENPTYCLWHWRHGAYYETIWQDSCLDTVLWSQEPSTTEFDAFETVDDTGNLAIQGDVTLESLYATNIPPAGAWRHGPLFIRELPNSIRLMDIRSFEACTSLIYEYGLQGDLVISLFDESKDRVMDFHVYDNGIAEMSKAKIRYYREDSSYSEVSLSEEYIWHSRFRFWYDCNSQSLKGAVSILGSETGAPLRNSPPIIPPYTEELYSAGDFNKERRIRFVGIQFTREFSLTPYEDKLRLNNLILRYYHSSPQVYYDHCDSTSTWSRVQSTDGFQTFRPIDDTSGTLYTTNSYLYCDGISSVSTGRHGPMYITRLIRPVDIYNIKSFQACLELFDVGGKMGDLTVMLYDENKQLVNVFFLYDAWYGPLSKACFYCYDSTMDPYLAQEFSGSWSGWYNFWREGNDDALKCQFNDGTIHTHFSSGNYDKYRKVAYIGIQFSRKESYVYHGIGLRIHTIQLELWT